jgi:hypothetical protein
MVVEFQDRTGNVRDSGGFKESGAYYLCAMAISIKQ